MERCKVQSGFRLFTLVVTGCLAPAAFLSEGCTGNRETASPRHVVVISLDTTRPDHLGCYGNPWIETPNIDAFAGQSIVFDNLLTAAPTTLASHTSLFTGTYPHTHGVARNGLQVNPDNVMLAEVLKSSGFLTAGIIGAFPLSDRFDFAQGFDFYDETLESDKSEGEKVLDERSADKVTDAVIRFLDGSDVPDRLFLFVHYFDPHWPFNAQPPYYDRYKNSRVVDAWLNETQGVDVNTRLESKKKINSYASEVSYMDKHVGRLLRYLEDRGILDNAITVITSDHGENFLDHPHNFNHGFTVYQSAVRGVGMIRLPGADRGGTRVPQLISNIDILPTILTILGLPATPRLEGQAIDLAAPEITVSARTRFSQGTKPHKEVETDPTWFNIRKSRCIIAGDFKFIQTPYQASEELYDLSADPGERVNLIEAEDATLDGVADRLRRQLQAWADSAKPLPQPSEPQPREISDDTIRRLKSLGYIE